MKIVVSSQSQVKLDAVKNALTALGIEAEIIGIKVKSNVPEQPMDDETLLGARNRAANAATHARQLAPDADLYISIENGIYTQTDGRYIDKAVVLAVAKDGTEAIAYSEGVEFPKDCVEEARRRGFDTTTVGKVMQELGIVEKHDDPHLTLAGRWRAADILGETVTGLLSQALKWAKAPASQAGQTGHAL